MVDRGRGTRRLVELVVGPLRRKAPGSDPLPFDLDNQLSLLARCELSDPLPSELDPFAVELAELWESFDLA